MNADFDFSDLTTEFLPLTPPKQVKTANSSINTPFSLQTVSSLGSIENGSPYKMDRESRLADTGSRRRKLSQRIADMDAMVARYKQLEQEHFELKQSAQEINKMYEAERCLRIEHEEKRQQLQERNAALDADLVNVHLQRDQLEATLANRDGPYEYSRLVVLFVRFMLRVDEERPLHWQERIILKKLMPYCEEKKLNVSVPTSPKKRKPNAKKNDLMNKAPPAMQTAEMGTQCDGLSLSRRAQSTQCEQHIISCDQGTQHSMSGIVDMGTQCDGLSFGGKDQSTQSEQHIMTCDQGIQRSIPEIVVHPPPVKEITDQSTQFEYLTMRSQGTQHIGTTTTRGTSTSCFIRQHHVGTNFPERKPLPSVSDMLQEYNGWQCIKPISPIEDVTPPSSPPPPARDMTTQSIISYRTVGTCTNLSNVQRHIGVIPVSNTTTSTKSIKRSNSRPPSRCGGANIKCENTLHSPPILSMPTPSTMGHLHLPTFHELWQVFGKMLYGLLQHGSSAATNYTCDSVPDLQSRMFSLYYNGQQQHQQPKRHHNQHCEQTPLPPMMFEQNVMQNKNGNTMTTATTTKTNDFYQPTPCCSPIRCDDFDATKKDALSTPQHVDASTTPMEPPTVGMQHTFLKPNATEIRYKVHLSSPNKSVSNEAALADRKRHKKLKKLKKREKHKQLLLQQANEYKKLLTNGAEEAVTAAVSSASGHVLPLTENTEEQNTTNIYEAEKNPVGTENGNQIQTIHSINDNDYYDLNGDFLGFDIQNPTEMAVANARQSNASDACDDDVIVYSAAANCSINDPRFINPTTDVEQEQREAQQLQNDENEIENTNSMSPENDDLAGDDLNEDQVKCSDDDDEVVITDYAKYDKSNDDDEDEILVIDEEVIDDNDDPKTPSTVSMKSLSPSPSPASEKPPSPASPEAPPVEIENKKKHLISNYDATFSEWKLNHGEEPPIALAVDVQKSTNQQISTPGELQKRGRKRKSSNDCLTLLTSCKRSQRLQEKRARAVSLAHLSPSTDISMILGKYTLPGLRNDNPRLRSINKELKDEGKKIDANHITASPREKECQPWDFSLFQARSAESLNTNLTQSISLATPPESTPFSPPAVASSSHLKPALSLPSLLPPELPYNDEQNSIAWESFAMPLRQAACNKSAVDVATADVAATNTKEPSCETSESPLSPQASDDEDDASSADAQGQSIRKIPLKLHVQLHPKKFPLIDRLAEYYWSTATTTPTHCTAKKSKQQKIENRLKLELQQYLQGTTVDALATEIESLVQSLFAISNDQRAIASAIVEFTRHLQRPEEELGCTAAEVPPKYVSAQLRCVGNVLSRLLCHTPSHDGERMAQALLHKIETLLFNCEGTAKLLLLEVLNLTQLYLLIMAEMEKFRQMAPQNSARLFVGKCLYYHQLLAIPMIYEVLCFYPTVLPHRDERTYDRSDALITVLQHVLMGTNYDMERRELRTRELLSMLRFVYHYEPFRPNSFEVLQNLMDKLRAGGRHLTNITYAMAIYCKRLTPLKVATDVVHARLLPLANEFYPLLLQSTEHDERVATLLECISMVVKPFPLQTNVSVYLAFFARFLNAVERLCVQEAAVQAILRLQRFGFTDCYRALQQFTIATATTTPDSGNVLHANTQAMLRTFIMRKSFAFWRLLGKHQHQ